MRAFSCTVAILLFQTVAMATSNPTTQSKTSLETVSTPNYQHTLQLGFIKKNLGISAQYESSENVRYEPNTPTSFGLGYSNRKLGIAFAVSLGKSRSDEDEKKKIQSTDQDYQFRYFNNNIGFELLYQDYRGFEAIADRANDYSLMSDSEKYQPDLIVKNYAMQFDWAFKGHSALEFFSASWDKPQVDGAGFYVISSVSQTEFSSPRPFLPQNFSMIVEDRGLTQGKYLTATGGVAASYVWQWSHWYMAGLMSLQAGPQWQQYERTTGNSSEVKLTWFPHLKGVVGYDWGNYYTNLIAHAHTVTAEMADTKLSIASQEVGWYFGGRF
ncbi:DUF4421 family protein [Bdellovibrio sp. HCB2-146]|uniref:DUF4421 family protein n=1 Tax=Bdellovibrio sp. HCB2-146 TaxID=3394362 RepID=UPI0039BD233C